MIDVTEPAAAISCDLKWSRSAPRTRFVKCKGDIGVARSSDLEFGGGVGVRDLNGLESAVAQQLRCAAERAGRCSSEVLSRGPLIASLAAQSSHYGHLQLKHAPTTRTGMLSRKLVADVFEAFVNPDIAAQFWFTKNSGRLEAGKQVKWDWEMYGISISVIAKAIEPNKRIVIEWPGHGRPTPVEWIFTPQKHGATFVGITHLCFTSDGDELVKQMTDSRDFRIPKPRPFQFGSVDRYFVIVIDRQIKEASRYKILFSSFSRCRSRLRRCETVGQREAT